MVLYFRGNKCGGQTLNLHHSHMFVNEKQIYLLYYETVKISTCFELSFKFNRMLHANFYRVDMATAVSMAGHVIIMLPCWRM